MKPEAVILSIVAVVVGVTYVLAMTFNKPKIAYPALVVGFMLYGVLLGYALNKG